MHHAQGGVLGVTCCVKHKTISGLLWAFLLRFLTITGFAFASEKRTFTVLFHTVQGMILLDAVVGGKPASLLLDTEAATPSSARVPPAWMRFSFEPY